MATKNKDIVRSMIDRQILNLYKPLKENAISNAPILETIINNFENQIINWINKKVDLLMDLSFPTGEETAEEGMNNMNKLINAVVVKKLEENGVDKELLNFDLTKILK